MKIAILLTATIIPMTKGGHFTIDERKEMYLSTLKYYAKVLGKTPDYSVFFVENSNYDLSFLYALQDDLNIDFLQFDPSEFENSKGKGYNEYLMISKAILHSKKLNEYSHFLKTKVSHPQKIPIK